MKHFIVSPDAVVAAVTSPSSSLVVKTDFQELSKAHFPSFFTHGNFGCGYFITLLIAVIGENENEGEDEMKKDNFNSCFCD